MLCPCPRAALAAVALVLIVAGPAAGHSELKTALPGPNDDVDAVPAALVVAGMAARWALRRRIG